MGSLVRAVRWRQKGGRGEASEAAGRPLRLHQLTRATKLSAALPKVLTKNSFLHNDRQCLSMSQNQNFVDSLSDILTYT